VITDKYCNSVVSSSNFTIAMYLTSAFALHSLIVVRHLWTFSTLDMVVRQPTSSISPPTMGILLVELHAW